MTIDQTISPPLPRRLKSTLTRQGDRWTLSVPAGNWAIGIFLLLWLTGWTAGCVMLAREVLAEPKWSTILFGLPFWASWVFVAFLAANTFFCTEKLTLDREGAEFEVRVIARVRHQATPLKEIQGFVSEHTVDSENGSLHWHITMQTDGKRVEFGSMLADDERQWLVSLFDEHLVMMRDGKAAVAQRRKSRSKPPADDEDDRDEDDFDEGQAERMTAAKSLVQPPSDSSWRRDNTLDGIQLVQRGRLQWVACGFLVFVNLFWNGIVSAFVVGVFTDSFEEQSIARGWMLLFLFPFVVAGIFLLSILILCLLEPLRRTRWRFGDLDADQRQTFLGIGRTLRYPCDWLARIERAKLPHADGPQIRDTGDFKLRFVNHQDEEVFTIAGLTEGESRWIADLLLRERSEWFGS